MQLFCVEGCLAVVERNQLVRQWLQEEPKEVPVRAAGTAISTLARCSMSSSALHGAQCFRPVIEQGLHCCEPRAVDTQHAHPGPSYQGTTVEPCTVWHPQLCFNNSGLL